MCASHSSSTWLSVRPCWLRLFSVDNSIPLSFHYALIWYSVWRNFLWKCNCYNSVEDKTSKLFKLKKSQSIFYCGFSELWWTVRKLQIIFLRFLSQNYIMRIFQLLFLHSLALEWRGNGEKRHLKFYKMSIPSHEQSKYFNWTDRMTLAVERWKGTSIHVMWTW